MPNYIEIILTTKSFLDDFLTEEKPKILVGKQTESITEFLDQIAAIQTLNYEITSFFPISEKDMSTILKDLFGCTNNLDNSNGANINKIIKSLKTEDLKCDLKNIDTKPDIVFEIELQDLWDNYSRRRYQEGFLKDYLNNKSLYEELKKIINVNPEVEYYLNMNKKAQQKNQGFILGVPGASQQLNSIRFCRK